MIKYFCDRCDGEHKNTDLYKVDIACYNYFKPAKIMLCEKCLDALFGGIDILKDAHEMKLKKLKEQEEKKNEKL